MKLSHREVKKISLYVLAVTLVCGCQPVQIPNNSVLTISPSTRTIDITSEIDP